LDEGELREGMRGGLPSYMVPSRYVVLPDGLPLTRNGKLDRAALPAPGQSASTPSRSPSTRIEQMLADIWSSVLGIESIGLDDNFFDLGGHSLLAVQLIERVRNDLGGNLPLATLFESPTLASLADALMHAGQRDDASLVTLSPGSEDAALYCFHPGGGHVLGYQPLVASLRAAHAIYGVQSREVLDATWVDGSIAEMAERYTALIADRRPAGVLRLFGWSMGGVLAHAVAGRLEAMGRTVWLGLADPPLIDPASANPPLANGSREPLAVTNPHATLFAYAEVLGVYRHDELANRIDDQTRDRLERALLALTDDDTRLEHLLKYAHDEQLVTRHFNLDVAKWRYQRLCRAADLVRAHQLSPIASDLVLWTSEPRGGAAPVSPNALARLTSGVVDLRTLAVSHNDLVRAPDLIAQLRDALAAIR
ncbi:MAG: thioesterase domain-containing protein, partial [Pseudomonadota bacterium]